MHLLVSIHPPPPPLVNNNKITMGRGPKWTIEEYQVLAKAYREVGGDPIRGASQKQDDFYRRLRKAFRKRCPRTAGEDSHDGHWRGRSQKACKDAWERIRHDIGKFLVSLGKVNAMDPTGNPSEDNMINMAIAVHLGVTRTARHCDWDYPRSNWKFSKAYLELCDMPQFQARYERPNLEGEESDCVSRADGIEDDRSDDNGGSASESSARDQYVRGSSGELRSAGQGKDNGDMQRKEKHQLKKRSRLSGGGRDKHKEVAAKRIRLQQKEAREKERINQAKKLVELGQERVQSAYISELFQGFTMAKAQHDSAQANAYYKKYKEAMEEREMNRNAKKEVDEEKPVKKHTHHTGDSGSSDGTNSNAEVVDASVVDSFMSSAGSGTETEEN